MKQSYLKIILLIVAVVVVAAISFSSSKKIEAPSEIVGWKTFEDTQRGISFKYPEDIGTTYIKLTDWPPVAQVVPDDPICTQAGKEEARAGKTEPRKINGRDYCVTTLVEGAAGSMYTQYAYGTKIKDKYIFLTFTTRTPQCENYEEPNKTACQTERANLDIDNLADEIAQTIVLLK